MKKRWLLLGCAFAVGIGAVALWRDRPADAPDAPGVEAALDPAPAPAAEVDRTAPDAGAMAPEPTPDAPAFLDGDVTDGTGGIAQAEVEALRRGGPSTGCAGAAATRSVAGGSFTLGPLCPGQYDVRASRNGLFASAVATVDPGGRPRVALQLRAGTNLDVRVRDGQRKPVPGARVQVQDSVNGYSVFADTDAKGLAAFEGLAPRQHVVTAEKDGYLTATTHERTLPLGKDEVVLVLEAGARVEGRVLGPDGTPLADVDLRLGQRARKLGEGFDTTASGESADGGAFSIGLVRPGTYALVARHRGFRRLEKTVRAPGPPLTLTLTRGTTLDGVFLDADGVPVPAAHITARTADESDKIDPDYRDGGFHAEGLSAGDWTVAGMAKGADGGMLGLAVAKLKVKDEAAVVVTLELERGESISGRCVNAHGGGPADTDVIAVEAAVFKKLVLGGFQLSAAEPGSLSIAGCKGTFRLDGLRPGRYRLLGCGNDVDAPTAPAGAADVVLTCQKGKLTYRVVDAQRRPITRYSSFGAPEEHPDGRTERTFENPIDEVLTVRAPGFAVFQRPLKLEREAVVDLGDLVLTQARTLKGTVVDSGKRPVANADISYGVERDGLFRAKTAADGTFTLTDVGGEDATLFVRHPDFESARHPVAAADAVVEVVLTSARRVRGSVVTRDGRELRGVRVVARRATPGFGQRWSEDVADGRWELGGLPEGEFSLRLESSTGDNAGLSGFGPMGVKAEPEVDFVERIGGSSFAIGPRDDDGHPLEATVWLVPGTVSPAGWDAARKAVVLFGLEGDAAQDVHGFTAVPAGRWTAVVFFLKTKFWAAPVEVTPATTGVLTLTMPRGLY